MILPFVLKENILETVYFLENCKNNSTFYYTEDNKRIYATKEQDLKKLFKNSIRQFFEFDTKDNIKGIILIWRGLSESIERNYVKVSANDAKTVDNLLTVLLWNTDKELFVKLPKGSELLKVFMGKGFRFFHGRGKEILLRRPNYVSYANQRRDKSKESDRRHFSKQ